MAELTTPEELEEALLQAVRQHFRECGEVDLSSVSLRPADLTRMLPDGVGVAALMRAGFLHPIGSMLKLAPHVMAALRAPARAYAVGLIDEPVAPAAAGTTTCVAAPAPIRKRSHDVQLKRPRSVLSMPLVSGLPRQLGSTGALDGVQEPVPAVDLGTAGNFAILSKGISIIRPSAITGNIGVSPFAADAMTGFRLIADALANEYSTSTQVNGLCYAADYTSPTPSKLTTAIDDGELAYTDAASRETAPANLNRMAGLITGETLKAGVYEWDRDISFTDAIYIDGTEDDIFIFKTSGNVIVGSGARVGLRGGAKASNIFWRVAGFVEVGTTSHLEGILLVKNHAAFKAGSSFNGRIFAQTAVTLDSATITAP